MPAPNTAASGSRELAEAARNELPPLPSYFKPSKGKSGNGPLIPKLLADDLSSECPMAMAGNRLYRYEHGRYVPDAEQWVRGRVAEMLQLDWRESHPKEVVSYLRDTVASRQLWEAPPLDVLNLQNGLLDLDTLELRPHTPEHLSPVQLAAAYDPNATCPAIEKFIEEALPGDAALFAYELIGYLMVPDMNRQSAVMLLGPGGNGKSVFLELIRRVLGETNVASKELQKLDEDRFAAVGLHGKLANIWPDLSARALKGSSVFKSVVGGDPIDGEHKYHDSFTFKPFCRLLFSANAAPPTTDTSEGFFQRWLIVPFEVQFRGTGKEIPMTELMSQLGSPTELSGLVNLAIEGYGRVKAQNGFTPAESMERAKGSFRQQVDSVAGFVGEECCIGPDEWGPRPDFYPRYQQWCIDSGKNALSKANFLDKLKQFVPGHAERKRQGIWVVVGVSLAKDGDREPFRIERDDPRARADQDPEPANGTAATPANGTCAETAMPSLLAGLSDPLTSKGILR
jgi:putative DNA primase/helicase